MSSSRAGPNGSSAAATGRPGEGRNSREVDKERLAQLYEDEKKRIQLSCFSKQDPDGRYPESYITHVRVQEDASSPSSPPPEDSEASNKKDRVIIVAVRRSGRLRLHKARENNNQTFSIGKTWLLDHLTVIESFRGGAGPTPQDKDRQKRGGDTGMVITIQKPYFWKTESPHEKYFFIGSLLKIYRKYTGGKEPQLLGFLPSEIDYMNEITEQTPRAPHSSTGRASATLSPAPKTGGTDFSAGLPPDTGNPLQRPASSGASSMRTTESHDRIPPLPGQFPSDTPRSLRGQERTRSRGSQGESYGTDGARPPSRDSKARGFDPASSTESFHSSRLNAPTPPALGAAERLRSNGTASPLSRSERTADFPEPGPRSPDRVTSAARRRLGSSSSNQDTTPERRRPQMLSERPKAFNDDMPSPLEPRKTPVNETFSDDRRKPSEDPARAEDKGRKREDVDSVRVKDAASALASVTSPMSPSSDAEEASTQEAFRPGLGPMFKKRSQKELANQFRKAAMAANAFKPRAGGAGDRLRVDGSKPGTAPDGINGVFKAPAITKDGLRSPLVGTPDSSVVQLNPIDSEIEKKDSVASIPQIEEPQNIKAKKEESEPKEAQKEEPSAPAPQERKKRRPLDNSARFAEILGIPPVLLEGRTAEIEEVLEDIGWGPDEKKKPVFEDIKANLRKELAKAETGAWISTFEQGDERVLQVSKLLDKAIAECDELSGLLTLYSAELATLNEDVAFIEAQSQGLQVQTANQRLLRAAQQQLLDTICIPSSSLRTLRETPLYGAEAIAAVESALAQLFKAMLTIDPSLRHQERAGYPEGTQKDESNHSSSKISAEVSGMRAVQEKKEGYRAESVDFILRLKSHMNTSFREAEAATRRSIDKDRTRPTTNVKIDLHRRDQARVQLWIYAPLMLFTREIDSIEWDSILKMYENVVKHHYHDEYRECFSLWKQITKKSTGDEQDILFTNQEKENDSLVGRKLTVKRNRTLREGPRIPSADKAQEGKISPYEAFAGVLYDTCQSIAVEQNFCSDLFHLSSSGVTDFAELVQAVPPESRRGGDLTAYRQFDPDRNLAKSLQNMMEDIFSFWPSDLQILIDSTVAQDAIQGVGILCAIESKYSELEDSNQEFILHVLKQNRDRLTSRFDRFADEQIRGIEDTKVRIKKRKGVINFIKTFPYFSSAIETMLPSPRTDAFEVRDMVNHVYRRITRAMFESLKFIAKESPVVIAGQKSQGQGGDTEDKEVLNHYILIIENMNHYIEEVDVRNNTVLEEAKSEAVREMAESMNLYLSAILRRPLGKLLDAVESTETLVANATASGESPTSIAARASHSKSIFKKLLSTYDAKEVRHGIDALKKRVEKHLGNADDPGISRNLVVKVLRECEDRYLDLLDRTQKVVRDVYEGQIEVEFKRDDVVSAFRK